MKSVLFFTQNQWAFGQIHHALIKRLYTKGIYAHLLDFYKEYRQEELNYLKDTFDIFSTTPEAVQRLINYGVSPERIVAVAHAERDVAGGVANSGVDVFDHLKAYAVINPTLSVLSKNAGIRREPKVVLNGIDFDHYYSKPSSRLKAVGYAGADGHLMSNNTDCKRAHLLPRIMQGVKAEFKKSPHLHHLCMGGFYQTVDAVLVTSNYEACGLPIMEAAAAGRLVIAANVGYFDGSHGALCRMPDDLFVEDARYALEAHRDPVLYKYACENAQQYARENYDWEHRIAAWQELFE